MDKLGQGEGGGVKNPGNFADIICTWPLIWFFLVYGLFYGGQTRGPYNRESVFYINILIYLGLIFFPSACHNILSFFLMKLRDLLTRSIISFVDIFADRRKLPRIEMELILDNHNNIAFSPATREVSEMILSVVSEVR